ncbi:MAG TPA: DEAD/DEAH box helicase family protein [Polyangiaceae bacterium]|nr:DEAD/DEAH box helicase family protein [Polyangiaceae bacterium]
MNLELRFHGGTLELRGLTARDEVLPAVEGEADGRVEWDARAACHRAPGALYAPLVRHLTRAGHTLDDKARAYSELKLELRAQREPRPFQTAALKAWREAKGRGVVVLPTGAGKSYVAILAIAERQRSTLVVAPTLDLVRQWYDLLRTSFACEVGILGGGEHKVESLTVSTYDSAYLHMERYGNRFGLVIFDECHHLPGESYALTARMCLAPFRLGLTATPERADGREEVNDELIGPLVYREHITDLAGQYLAEYQTERVVIELTAEEREEYEAERAIYVGYVRQQGLQIGSPRGFAEFMLRSSRSEAGRRAQAAYRRQRSLAFAAEGKLDYLEHLLTVHQRDRMLVFTQDNSTAYAVSRRFLVPIITHQTKVKERSEILEGFDQGRYSAVVTSKVLNEGVDVPSANVAVVLSGSGSVMEHVQRLGRILRQHGNKRAMLYELVSARTSETSTSERRREHAAYKPRRFSGRRG